MSMARMGVSLLLDLLLLTSIMVTAQFLNYLIGHVIGFLFVFVIGLPDGQFGLNARIFKKSLLLKGFVAPYITFPLYQLR